MTEREAARKYFGRRVRVRISTNPDIPVRAEGTIVGTKNHECKYFLVHFPQLSGAIRRYVRNEHVDMLT